MRKIVDVIPREDHLLDIRFDDGSKAMVDVKPLMGRRVFEPLWDETFFRRVEIDEFGGLEWPNGADICVDWIEDQIGHHESLAESA